MEDRQKGSILSSKSAHFFKIILQTTIDSGKLVIPKTFVRKYGAELAGFDSVLLKVAGGGSWRVVLRRGDGVVWLEKGWLDFVNFYGIKHGHFLVFWHEPGSCNKLDVIVFDRTATEIEYPKKSHVGVKVKDFVEDDVDVISIDTRTSIEHLPSRITRSRGGDSRMMMMNGNLGQLKGVEKAKALERANSFGSSNPYVKIVMQPSYIYPSYKLHMPARFLMTYMGEKRRGEIKVHVSGDKIWTIGYRISLQERKIDARSNSGWRTFVIDNGLVLGDVCVFEVIRTLRSTSFKISIYRATQGSMVLGTSRGPSGAGVSLSMLENMSGPESKEKSASLNMKRGNRNQKIAKGVEHHSAPLLVYKYPYFQVAVTRSKVKILTVPAGFAREHLNMNCKEQMVTLQVGGRSWLTKLIIQHTYSSKAVLCAGFQAFAKGNSLNVGDVCTFELIQKEKMVFRVSVDRV